MRRFDSIEPLVMLGTLVQWLVLASLTGALVGCGTSLFLRLLFFFTGQTEGIALYPQMLLLPLAGLLNGLLLHYGYRLSKSGLEDTIFAAMYRQEGRMPFRTMWLKPVAALMTLALGGSAGKEGPCSHIGASFAAAVGRHLHLNRELRLRLVACGVSAGFASVFGTPVAGAIYGVEVLAIGRLRHDFLLPAVVAGATSYGVSRFFGVPYEYYRVAATAPFAEPLFLKTVLLGALLGAIALFFVQSVHRARLLALFLRRKFALWPPLLPLLGGAILALLVLFVPRDYLGLSLPLMDRALAGAPMPLMGFFWKSLFVAITLGSGFYGGVVTPQFVIGAVAGGAFAPFLGLDPMFGAAIGLAAMVAASSNTPVAAILMGAELFQGTVGLVYLGAAAISAYLVIGYHSIYAEQHLAYVKSTWMRATPDMAVGAEKARLSYGILRFLGRWRQGRRDDQPPPDA